MLGLLQASFVFDYSDLYNVLYSSKSINVLSMRRKSIFFIRPN